MTSEEKSSTNLARRKVAYLLRPPEKRHRFGINSLVVPYAGEPDTESSQVVSLFSGGRDGTIRGWSKKGENILNLEEHVDWVNDLLFLPSGVLVSCSSDTTVKVWDVKETVSVSEEFLVPRGSSNTLAEHTDYVKALTAVDRHRGIVASGSLDGKIVIWDLEKGEYQSVLGKGLQENTSVYCLASGGKSFGLEESSEQFLQSPEGSIIAAGSSDRVISLWDTRTRTRAVKLRGHRDIIRCLAMNEQGTLLLSGSSDGSTRVWDLRNLRCMLSFDVHIDSVWALAASKNFDWFLSGGRDGAVWKTELHTGDSVLMIAAVEDNSKYNHVLRVCMTPDEKSLWTSSLSSNIKYWESNKCFNDIHNQNSKDMNIKSRTSPISLRSVLSTSATDDPIFKEPYLAIRGEPGIVAKTVLNNRRHVLTCDSEGKVQLWDVSRGRLLQDFGNSRTMEDIQQEIDEMVVVPTWFHLVTRLGSLMVVLDPNVCFAAEVYASDAGLDVDSDEVKVNIGEHVLRGLFRNWHERYSKLLEGSPKTFYDEINSLSHSDPAESNQKQTAVLNNSNNLPPYEFPEDIPVIIIEEGTTRPLLRKLLKDFDGTEASYLPDWVLKCVRDEHSMSREIPKLSFYLKPAEGSGFPALVQSKLTAPRILRAKKLATYVANNIRTEIERLRCSSKGGKLPFEFSPTAELEIVCRDQVVPPKMSLIAIRRFIWKSPEDLELFYRRRNEAGKRTERK
ncbi:transducin family protein / WD-40 repeat family protein [Galdieria sulphuraria]|uniref:Transducin family protein / WD-40 repeat family protein n=1 Tax=Galdieria sulphuraria TaxID=130081 RepID=M2XGQ4_GALSU|nr:transducin family protein / WD-40 repeat family protein [Galdieria sulphuraria]EME29247.1 transducin family protein / WD-40 repeat family protein [Galdieria sulphuraria]|eukprot:XP_005705767.1 transducin family protein / WD-40 repeat family protein [Galdieria sulphuraria]